MLSEILPKKVQDQVKHILSLAEEEFPNKDAYLQLKKSVLRIFGPKPEAAVARAFNRVLTDKPSVLARALVNDLAECRPQVWSLTQFSSVDFSQSRIGVKKCGFNKRTIKACVSCR